MDFQIEFLHEAASDWKSLDPSVKRRLSKAIDRLKAHPSLYGKALGGKLRSLRRIRSGDYRIVYRVLEASHKVEIVVACHRKDVYRVAQERKLI